MAITLEGGYDLKGLRDSVKAVLRELAGLSETSIEEIISGGDQRKVEYAVQQVREAHGRFWKNLLISS